MNDFSELEAELKKLRPAQPSQELVARIENALQQSATQTPAAGVMKRRKIQWNWLPLGLGLAAAATFLILARVNVDHAPNPSRTVAANSPAASVAPQTNRPGTAAAGLVAEGLTQVVYSTRDEGIHFAKDATPLRRVRPLNCPSSTRKGSPAKWSPCRWVTRTQPMSPGLSPPRFIAILFEAAGNPKNSPICALPGPRPDRIP